MCVIIVLPENEMMAEKFIKNAVWNNPHSMGLIVKDSNGRTSMIKECPEEVNPDRVMELLEQYKDCKRYLHLRWATKGGKTEENTQFFEVYSSNKRTIYFGHNGTLGVDFGGHGEKDPSDSRDFAEKVVQRALLHWSGSEGKADYTDPVFHELIVKPRWVQNSKGILISNDLDDLMFGPDRDGWQQFTVNGEKTPIMVSNNDYFTELKRGPEFERQKAKKAAEEAAKRVEQGSFRHPNGGTHTQNGGGSTALALNFSRDLLSRDIKVLEALNKLFENKNIMTKEGLRAVAYMTREEVTGFVAANSSAKVIELIILLSDALDDVMKDLERGNKKILRMQKRIDQKEGRIDDEGDEDEDEVYAPGVNFHTAG